MPPEMRRIKVIVPVCTDMWNAPVEGLLNAYKEPATQISVENLGTGPESLEFAYDKAFAELPTVQEAEKAEAEGFDGVIIYCFADPGLAAAREKLSIPVVGLCETSIHLASQLGSRFSILLAGSERMFGNKRIVVFKRLKEYEFEHKCASIRPLNVPVLDLEAQHEAKVSRLLAEAKAAIEEDGADTIVLGCGGILHIGEDVSKALNAPVVIPALAALKTCELLLQMSLLQSKRCYPMPEQKKRLA